MGEIWHDARRWLSGDQFDACTNYLMAAACLSFFPGQRLDLELAHRVGGYRDQVQPIDAQGFADRVDWLLGLYNPDVTRVQLNPLDSHDTPRFLTCAGGDVSSLKLALTFVFTVPGAPCLFYGDEVGLHGGYDPECRPAFIWAEHAWNHDLLEFTKGLAALRRARRDWRWGSFRRLYSAGGVYAFERRLDGEHSVVVLNTSEESREIGLESEIAPTTKPMPLLGEARILGLAPLRIGIPPRSAGVLALDSEGTKAQEEAKR